MARFQRTGVSLLYFHSLQECGFSEKHDSQGPLQTPALLQVLHVLLVSHGADITLIQSHWAGVQVPMLPRAAVCFHAVSFRAAIFLRSRSWFICISFCFPILLPHQKSFLGSQTTLIQCQSGWHRPVMFLHSSWHHIVAGNEFKPLFSCQLQQHYSHQSPSFLRLMPLFSTCPFTYGRIRSHPPQLLWFSFYGICYTLLYSSPSRKGHNMFVQFYVEKKLTIQSQNSCADILMAS